MSQSEIRNSKSEMPEALILAGGRGSRMGGDRAKVLYEAGGRAMIHWVVQACREAGVGRCLIVVGYRGDDVREALKGESDCVFIEQGEQLGTGHAAQVASPWLAEGPARDVFVLAGDAPLVRAQTLRRLRQAHQAAGASATLATAVLEDPSGYGRVLRDGSGGFERIVEQKDASPEQLAVREVNPSYYCFRSDRLLWGLERIDNDNAQGEYYLTDVPGLLREAGERVAVVDAVPAEDVLGVNTAEQLAVVDAILRRRQGGGAVQEAGRQA